MRALIGHAPLILSGGRVIIENDKEEILLHKRRDFKDTWSLPGGILEIGESIEETLVREVLEETGIILHEYTGIGLSTNPKYESFSYPNGDQVQLIALVLYSKNWEGKTGFVGEETVTTSFFNLDELPKMRPNELHSLEAFKKYKKTNLFQLH